MSHVCRAFRPAAIALCVVIALAGSAWAQTDVTTARIAGVVKDASAGPLPGVTVEAKSQETGFTATAVTTVFAECFNCSKAANRTLGSTVSVWNTNNSATPLASCARFNSIGDPRTIQIAARVDF